MINTLQVLAILFGLWILLFTSRLQERQKLDWRRMEDAFFQYAVLTVASWYGQHFSLCQLPMHNLASETVAHVTETYHGLFMSHYSGELW